MEIKMIKEALICGFGMVMDLSGTGSVQCQNRVNANDGIASDWKQVGSFLSESITKEGPKIQVEAAKQLQLKLS